MPKVLLVASEFPPGPGGIGAHAWELARGLVVSDWSVRVLAQQDYSSAAGVASFNQEQPFPILTVGRGRSAPRTLAGRILQFRQILAAEAPDLIVTSGSSAVWLSALIGRKIPTVAVGHGTEFASHGVRLKLVRWAYRKATAVIFVSEFTRSFARSVGIAARQDVVIHNGGDDQTFAPLSDVRVREIKESWGAAGLPVLLTVGNVSERKGQHIVIAALPRVIQEVGDVLYVMVGLPTRRAELERLAREVGVLEHVRFCGVQDRKSLAEAYGSCDVYVMTSRRLAGDFEGYGIACVEAALCGKPSIVSRGSGLTEAVEDGITGVLVNEDDPQDTAIRIIELLSDNEGRGRLGRQARERALAEQTWKSVVARYDGFLRGVLFSQRTTEDVER